MEAALKFYRWLNILSVDVALGAVCCALFFAKMLHVTLLSYGMIALGLTVWIIYTADHLLDTRKLNTTASTTRHKFHQLHFKSIVTALIVAGAIDCLVIFFIRRPVLINGLFLGLGVALYLLLHRYVKIVKEFSIALLYTSGVLLPSISVASFTIDTFPTVIVLQFFITALINLLLFSLYDFDNDIHDGHPSFATITGQRVVRVALAILFTGVFMLSLLSFQPKASLVIIGMNAFMLPLFVLPNIFKARDSYRLIGDAVFFIPILYLLF
jgi:hypothetical protein